MTDAAEKIDLELEEGAEILSPRQDAARSWLKDFRKSEKLEKIALARRLGLGDNGRAAVSRFLDGQDDAVLTLAAERLRATIEGPTGIATYVGWQPTRCARTVIEFATKVRSAGLFGAIVGPVGAGKTEALKKFQQATRNDGLPRVRILRARSTMSLPGMVRGLAEDMGVKGGDISRLHSEIVTRLCAGRNAGWSTRWTIFFTTNGPCTSFAISTTRPASRFYFLANFIF